MATLRRIRDNEGFSGSRTESIDPYTCEVLGPLPRVGAKFLVGSMTAGTYSTRDFWLTTPVIEIISATNKEIKFKTMNSEYSLTV